MKFHKISMTNFMSIGDTVEIDFDKMSGVVLIKGLNLDVGPEASNGAGKSLIIEAILYALYGKTLRGLSKDEVINNINQKRCSVVLEFDEYKIERARKPNKLRVWKGEEEISLSTMPRTDELIIELTGVDYTTFCNIFCFGQHNAFSFISATEKTRREIVENLLSLSNYNTCLETTRAAVRGSKAEIKDLTTKFEYVSNELNASKRTKETREAEKRAQEEKLIREVKELQAQMSLIKSLDLDSLSEEWRAYDKAQAQIPRVQEEITKIEGELRSRRDSLSKVTEDCRRVETKLQRIKNLEAGVVCEKCFMEVDPTKAQVHIDEGQKQLGELQEKAKPLGDRIPALQKAEEASRDFITKLRSVPRPKKSREELQKIQSEVSKIEALIAEKQKKAMDDPYIQILKELEDKISGLEKSLSSLRKDLSRKEKLLPYLEFWVEGFGPEGIRAFIVENIVGFLNNQVNYWLQFLIENKIIVSFDKYLNVEIKRKTDEAFTYTQGSGGEKKRIDLAISLAFADLMRISNNTHNSLIFLDEVVDSLDFPGTEGTSKLIHELCKNKTVFIISHNPNLLSQLPGSMQLNLVKQGGFSKFDGLSVLAN